MIVYLAVEELIPYGGGASLLIMLGHCANALHVDRRYPFINVGWYCVALFFFISGYGIVYGCKHKPKYMEHFLLNRFIKVLIPFINAHIIYFVIKSCCGISFGCADLLKGLFGQGNVVDNSWYPVAIILMYSTFWLSNRIAKKKATLIISQAFCVVLISCIECIMLKDSSWWYISNFAFFLGFIISYADNEFCCKKTYFFIGCFAMGLSVILSRTLIFENESLHKLYLMIIYNIRSSGVVLITIIIILLFTKGSNRVALWLGGISYELYLMHGLFIFLYIRYWNIKNLFAFYCCVLILTIFSASILSYIDKCLTRKMLCYLVK